MKSFKITALSLVLVLLLAACGAKNDTPDEPAVDPTPEPPIEQPVEKTPDERINDIIADMSIEEKVGQLFFVRCPETGAAEDVETYHLGGLLLFGRDYKDANGDWLTEDDFTAALASYQAAAAIPLFIGSDEEGGTVTRASKNPNLFSEPLPSPQELYAAGGLDGLLERTLSYNQKLQRELRPRVRCVDESRQLHLRALVRAGRTDDRGLYLKRRARLCAVRRRLRLKALPRLRQQRRHAHGHRARRAPVHHV